MNTGSTICVTLSVSALSLALAGCTTLLEPRARISDRDRRDAELANIKALTARLETRVESVDVVQQRHHEDALARTRDAEHSRTDLERRVGALEQRTVSQDQRIATLGKALAESERARAEDRKIVLETIKSASTPRPVPMRGREHVVRQGETLSEIAKAYNVTVSAIIKVNNLKDAHIIRIGQTLFIPD